MDTSGGDPMPYVQPGTQYTFTVTETGSNDWHPKDGEGHQATFTKQLHSSDTWEPDNCQGVQGPCDVADYTFHNNDPGQQEADFTISVYAQLPEVDIDFPDEGYPSSDGRSGVVNCQVIYGPYANPPPSHNSNLFCTGYQYAVSAKASIQVQPQTLPQAFRDTNAKSWRIGFVQNVQSQFVDSAYDPSVNQITFWNSTKDLSTFITLPLLDATSEAVQESLIPFYSHFASYDFSSDNSSQFLAIHDSPSCAAEYWDQRTSQDHALNSTETAL